MTIRTVNITSIEARRFTDSNESNPKQVRIDHNSTVTMVTPIDDDAATVDFRYTASYGGLGIIKVEGEAQVEGDAQALQAEWQEDNRMPQEQASQVHTAVMRTCVPEAVQLARDLSLPPPIPLPEIRFDGDKTNGKNDGNASGPEIH